MKRPYVKPELRELGRVVPEVIMEKDPIKWSERVTYAMSEGEARTILGYVMEKHGLNFAAFDPPRQWNSIIGLVQALSAMQELGWKIVPPTLVVTS